jgi:hypothetical protein
MELIQGQSMTRWRRMTGITIEQQARLIRDLALALDTAHKAGVVHRDIKPQNVLVDRDHQPHLTDFGLAKVTGQKEDLAHTMPGKVWGTPTYMSPEHAKGQNARPPDGRLLARRPALRVDRGPPPFRSDKPSEILDKLVREPVPPIAKFLDPATVTPLQRDLEQVCIKALSKTPAERHASARAFADDVSRCLGEGQAAAANKKLVWTAGGRRRGRARTVAVFLFSGPSLAKDLAGAERLLAAGKLQEAVAAYDRVLAGKPPTSGARGRKAAAEEGLRRHRSEKAPRRRRDRGARKRARAEGQRGGDQDAHRGRRKADEEDALTQQRP